MSGQQLDLFSPPVAEADRKPAPLPPRRPAATLDDSQLLAAIPAAGLADGPALVLEAGRRRLGSAIPLLERLCRRFSGFGVDRAVPEQAAALEALAMIGGVDAAGVVARLIARRVVLGPTLAVAVAAAARLGASLPADVVAALLKDARPAVRADACRCARSAPAVIAILVDLLDDLDAEVRAAAACALGRLGRPEARAALAGMLRIAPTAAVIDAVTGVADEDCIIRLARIARTMPHLAACALEALEALDDPLARKLIDTICAERRGSA